MKENTQEAEKLFRHPQGALHVHSIFPTIQGEGPFAGTPCTFVRLAGCNLKCPACDTDYTSVRETNSPSELVARVRREGFKPAIGTALESSKPLVVITGGEPFRQNLTPFVTLLLGLGYRVQIETNGTLFLDGFPYDDVCIVCSPKTGRASLDLLKQVDAFKYVVQEDHVDVDDGLPLSTLGHKGQTWVARPPPGFKGEIYVQPLDERNTQANIANTNLAVETCLRFGYRLCIQTHKLCNLP